MNSKPISAPSAVIHHDAALRVIRAALAKAETIGMKACVAVVDGSGTLAGFARMPGAFLISGDISIKKAFSAAAIGAPADVVEQILSQEAPRVAAGIVGAGYLTVVQGGIPLRDGDILIGAVGVSGGSEAQDVECAKAGAAALLN
jgi:uncharacterized protein GlcG (DUF336 family)